MILFLALSIIVFNTVRCDDSKQGPVFIYEPPHKVEFLNSSGAVVDCSAHSDPDPKIRWTKEDGSSVTEIPRLRLLPRNGSLVFPPFSSNIYRQDVHTAVYRCTATNSFGTIVSRPARVRAAVKQTYQGQVYDDYVIKGNTALFKCQIPSFVKDYVDVTAWLRGDNFVIRTGPSSGSRYSSFKNGFLHIRNVMENDNNVAYWCQTTHKISGETSISSSSGRLIVEAPRSIVQPRITHTEQEVRCIEGDTIEIPCAAQAYPVPRYSCLQSKSEKKQSFASGLKWFKEENEKTIPIMTSQRIIQLSGSLIIHRTNAQDSGTYVCHVNNSVGSQQSKTSVIISAPYAVYVLPQRQRVDVNNLAQLNCTVTGSPTGTVTWLKDGLPIRFSSRVKLISPFVLQIEKVERQDGGMYQCFADNGYEAAQGTSQLYLGDVSPIITKGFRETTLQPGPEVILSCTGTGNPLPSFYWTLDGEEVTRNQRFKISEHLTYSRQVIAYLNITNIKTNEGGEYGCVARNKAGVAAYAAKVNIYGLPFIRDMQNTTVVSGENLSIRCYVGGFPIQAIKWQRDSASVSLSSRHQVFKNGTLVIRNTKAQIDDGIYTCLAKSRKGQSASKSVWIKVLVKPEIAPIPVPPHIKDGARITLMCSVMRGDPPIDKKWLKDGAPIPHQLGVQITDVSHNSLLEIDDIHSFHDGNYTCVASNKAGSAMQTATIQVEVPPSWIKLPRDATASPNEDITILCSVQGHPRPTVKWIKMRGNLEIQIISDNKFEVYKNGSLKIRSISLRDEGKYQCTVSNGLEPNLSAVIQLNVGARPLVTVTNEILSVKAGESTKLQCTAAGDPPIKITWLTNKQIIEHSSRFKVRLKTIKGRFSDRRKSSYLEISSVNRADSNVYTCSAANGYGSSTQNISLQITDKPDPPTSVKVTKYFNGTLTLAWKRPEYVGNIPLLSYILQHKPRPKEWSQATNTSIDSRKLSTQLSRLKVGIKYDLRLLAVNSNGVSLPGPLVRFIPSMNGTLILESSVSGSTDSALETSAVIWLVIPVVICIIIIAIIIILALVYFHKRSLASNSPTYEGTVPPKKGDLDVKQCLMDELQKSQMDRYGKLGQSNEDRTSHYYTPKDISEYGTQYAPSTSSARYAEVEISPYATFHLPENKSPDHRIGVEMKTFSRRYDVPKIDSKPSDL